jgi:hypothetical protein
MSTTSARTRHVRAAAQDDPADPYGDRAQRPDAPSRHRGGGKITLTGAGKRRILYMNTCDPRLGITTSHCQDQATPRLVLQNITLANGNSIGSRRDGGGGGAVFVRGGRFTVVNSRFFNNRCEATGPDIGGAAIRVLDQFDDKAVYVNHGTFGGAPGYGGICSNGGAPSSIGVTWVVLNSVISNNRAIGRGANPPTRARQEVAAVAVSTTTATVSGSSSAAP